MAFGDVGLIYPAIWLVAKTSGVWRLAALAVAFRFLGRTRWIGLDWMRCRPETAVRGTG